jgi:hypothetical protein
MGLFSNIKETKVSKKGVWLTPGAIYDLEIENILVKKTRASGWAFIVEFRVLDVSGNEEAISKHAIGSRATWFQSLQDEDIGLSACKDFISTLMGEDPEDEEFNEGLEELMEQITDKVPEGEEHMFRGEKIRCETFLIQTKKGQDFTVHNWSHVDSEAA